MPLLCATSAQRSDFATGLRRLNASQLRMHDDPRAQTALMVLAPAESCALGRKQAEHDKRWASTPNGASACRNTLLQPSTRRRGGQVSRVKPNLRRWPVNPFAARTAEDLPDRTHPRHLSATGVVPVSNPHSSSVFRSRGPLAGVSRPIARRGRTD